jgi:5,10-methylenetetrahydromethanopterin reductase
MRIGIHSFSAGPTLAEQIKVAVDAEEQGLNSCWFGHIFGHDALTLAALAARETKRIEIGTAVAQTYLRHPFLMAQQAVTTQVTANGLFSLGIGPSHKVLVQDMLGLPYEHVALHMREYLSVLVPLIKHGNVAFTGEEYRVVGALQIPDARPCQVLISALAPMMLRIAGELADGTILVWTGPKTIETHYLPLINKVADTAGRPPPRVCVMLPVAVTKDVDAAREQAAKTYEMYGRLPNYQRVLAREGATKPEELAVVGEEADVERQIRALSEAGATDFLAWAYPVGDDAAESLKRTWALLSGVAGKAGG